MTLYAFQAPYGYFSRIYSYILPIYQRFIVGN